MNGKELNNELEDFIEVLIEWQRILLFRKTTMKKVRSCLIQCSKNFIKRIK